MERFDRHAEHAGPHQEESRGLVCEALLLCLEWHPAGIGRAADAATEAKPIALHARLADTSRDAQISLDRIGKASQVCIGDEGSGGHAREPGIGVTQILCVKTVRPFGEPAMNHDQQQEHIRGCARPGVAPGREDDACDTNSANAPTIQ